MATINKDNKGWRILVVDHQGKRRTIRPGKIDKKGVQHIARHLDVLVAAKIAGQPFGRQTALWIEEIGNTLHDRLSRLDLITARESDAVSQVILLSEFLNQHVEQARTATGKPAAKSTVSKWKGTENFLNDLFHKRPLNSITQDDAHQFRVWLNQRRIKQKTAGRNGQPMSENAKRKHIANCKMFFNAAKRRGLVDSNPFEFQTSSTEVNRSRDHYITPEDTLRLLNSAPDAQWRLMIALWRLGGLRKMEIFNLVWADYQPDYGRLLVRSTKTAHVEGCDFRFVPLRDIEPYVIDAFQAAYPKGKRSVPSDQPMLTRYSRSNSNLDKPFCKIVLKAGLLPWPKLFQNLRSSCETQWIKEGARADLLANWIGHSVKIQRQNYLQHTEEDIHSFNATKSGTPNDGNGQNRAADGSLPVIVSPSKNAGEQRFSTSTSPKLNTPGGT